MEIGPQKLTILGDSGIFREYSLLFWANPIFITESFLFLHNFCSPLSAHRSPPRIQVSSLLTPRKLMFMAWVVSFNSLSLNIWKEINRISGVALLQWGYYLHEQVLMVTRTSP